MSLKSIYAFKIRSCKITISNKAYKGTIRGRMSTIITAFAATTIFIARSFKFIKLQIELVLFSKRYVF